MNSTVKYGLLGLGCLTGVGAILWLGVKIGEKRAQKDAETKATTPPQN